MPPDEAPIQTEVLPADPGAFGPGSFAPATESGVLSLKDRLRQASSATDSVRQELLGTGKPRRSRTPKAPTDGAKDKPTVDELHAERAKKKKRANEIAGDITNDLNDVIMQLAMSQGVPPAFLYNKGHVPANVDTSGKYTELGSRLAIDSFTASMVGAFVVEFEGSDIGAQLVAKTTGGPVGLVIKGLVAGACVVGYLRTMQQTVAQIKPLAEAYKQYQKQQADQAANRQNGVPSVLN